MSASMDNYTSFGSFAPPYKDALRRIMDSRDWQMLRVFNALMLYVDQYGLCYPDVKTLAKVAGTRTDVVRATLQRLFKMGLVRGQRLPDALGNPKYYFQISPYAMFIKDKYIDKVLLMWLKGESQFEGTDSEAESQTKHKNNQNSGNRISDAEQAKKASEAESYPPPENCQGNSYISPKSLFDKTEADVEQLVQEIAATSSTQKDSISTKKQMRQHISHYGYRRVAEAFGEVRRRIAQGKKVDNPPGLLVTLLRDD